MAESWKVDGMYMEACNCKSACPCVFLSPPTEGECTALVAWHIDKGNYGDLKLDTLNVAAAIHSPGTMAESKWRVALYLDDRASDDQRDALLKIFSGQAGGHPKVLADQIGEVLGIKTVKADAGTRIARSGRALRCQWRRFHTLSQPDTIDLDALRSSLYKRRVVLRSKGFAQRSLFRRLPLEVFATDRDRCGVFL
jgi:hypothetical protein